MKVVNDIGVVKSNVYMFLSHLTLSLLLNMLSILDFRDKELEYFPSHIPGFSSLILN